MSLFAPTPSPALPPAAAAPTPPPVFGEAPGSKPKQKSMQPTFLGGDVTPGPSSGNLGGKTLLGL